MTARQRARIVVTTSSWDADGDESAAVARLVAGAAAAEAAVTVVHLDRQHRGAVVRRRDGAFELVSVPASPPELLAGALVRAALAAPPDELPPDVGAEVLLRLEGGYAPDLGDLVVELDPDVVVLAGARQWWNPGIVATPRLHARVVSLPLLSDDPMLVSRVHHHLLDLPDAVGVLTEPERALVTQRLVERRGEGHGAHVELLDVALPLNRDATTERLAGTDDEEDYVVVLRCFPPGTARAPEHVPPALVRDAVGTAVVEVDGARWEIVRRTGPARLQVQPSRVNLWRLLAHARATVELRRQRPLDREVLESLLLGTPVVAPVGSTAAAHLAALGGGVTVDGPFELLRALRELVADPARRDELGVAGAAAATRRHGDHVRFASQVRALLAPR